MSQHTETAGSATTHHHIIPLKIYLAIGGALLFLTLVTVVTAQIDFSHLLNIPHFNIVLAMIIATVKATLVALFFMHLYYDNKIYLTVFLISVLTLGVFIALTMFDTMRRADPFAIEGGVIEPRAKMYENRDNTPTH